MPLPFNKRYNYQGKKIPLDYIPAPSSGAHVILVGMLKAKQFDFIENLTKQQILDHGKKYGSTNGPKDDSKIWPSITSLINRNLILRKIGREPLYTLTQNGEELARRLVEFAEGGPQVNEDSQDADGPGVNNFQYGQLATDSEISNSCSSTVVINSDSTFELKSGTYEIYLIVDQREKIDIHMPDASLKKDIRTLACGDFIWVARPKGLGLWDKTKDLVLDYVIERKRLDDLLASLTTGRFDEQRQRLKNVGVRRPMYLIEDYGQLRTNRLTSTDLTKVVTDLLIRDNIEVQNVKNVSHANDFLIGMTRCLQKFFADKDIKSCDQEKLKSGRAQPHEYMTFSDYQTKGVKIKNFTVREMFAKHLIQISGMSGPRVAVITEKYPTISALIEAYSKCTNEKDKENLLAKLQVPNSTKIGPALSKRVYTAYST